MNDFFKCFYHKEKMCVDKYVSPGIRFILNYVHVCIYIYEYSVLRGQNTLVLLKLKLQVVLRHPM